MRKLIALTALALVLTACGGAASTTKAAPTASHKASAVPTGPNVSGCYTDQDGAIFTYGDGMNGLIMGQGAAGVVITYERRGNVCSWRPLADRLVAAGYRVMLYNRRAADVPADVIVDMVKRMAKESGVEQLFLVGGSIGGTISVSAATTLKGVDGVVSLSGNPDPADAAKLTVPLLQIGSESDSYGGAADLERTRQAATKSPDNQVLVFKGQSTHASDLFTTPQAAQTLDAIVAFMDRHKG